MHNTELVSYHAMHKKNNTSRASQLIMTFSSFVHSVVRCTDWLDYHHRWTFCRRIVIRIQIRYKCATTAIKCFTCSQAIRRDGYIGFHWGFFKAEIHWTPLLRCTFKEGFNDDRWFLDELSMVDGMMSSQPEEITFRHDILKRSTIEFTQIC